MSIKRSERCFAILDYLFAIYCNINLSCIYECLFFNFYQDSIQRESIMDRHHFVHFLGLLSGKFNLYTLLNVKMLIQY